jgi:hypothetical protein
MTTDVTLYAIWTAITGHVPATVVYEASDGPATATYLSSSGDDRYFVVLMGAVSNVDGTNINTVMNTLDAETANGTAQTSSVYPTVTEQSLAYFAIDIYDWTDGSFSISFQGSVFVFSESNRRYYVSSPLLLHYEDGALTDTLTVSSYQNSVKFIYDAQDRYDVHAMLSNTYKANGEYVMQNPRWVAVNTICDVSFKYVQLHVLETCNAKIFQVPLMKVFSSYIRGDYYTATGTAGGNMFDLSAMKLVSGKGVMLDVSYIGNGESLTISDSLNEERYGYLWLSPRVGIAYDSYADANERWYLVYTPTDSTERVFVPISVTSGEINAVWMDNALQINDVILPDPTKSYYIDRIELDEGTVMAYTYIGVGEAKTSTYRVFTYETEFDLESFFAMMLVSELVCMMFLFFLMRRYDAEEWEKFITLLVTGMITVVTAVILYGMA